MPLGSNWNLFRKIYDIQPTNYEQLISIPGFGPAAVRALSLIGEIIFGTKASWQDPVKFNFAHGGKDGVPYPVARETYDNKLSLFCNRRSRNSKRRKDSVIKEIGHFFNQDVPRRTAKLDDERCHPL